MRAWPHLAQLTDLTQVWCPRPHYPQGDREPSQQFLHPSPLLIRESTTGPGLSLPPPPHTHTLVQTIPKPTWWQTPDLKHPTDLPLTQKYVLHLRDTFDLPIFYHNNKKYFLTLLLDIIWLQGTQRRGSRKCVKRLVGLQCPSLQIYKQERATGTLGNQATETINY